MEIEQFVYWLNGALEMNPDLVENGMTPNQVKTIKDHLDIVFSKITPDRFNDQSNITPGLSGVIHTPEITSDDSKLFCEKFKDYGTKMSIEAGKRGLVC